VACSAANGVSSAALCGVPLVAATAKGAAAVFVRLKFAVDPPTLAVTVKVPAVLFAVRVGVAAMPLVLVVAYNVVKPPDAALAPDVGAVKVTVAPFKGLPFGPVTVTCKGVANAVPTTVLCGVPPVAVILLVAMDRAAAFRVTRPGPVLIAQVTTNV
jgi:hypothetical protein